MKVTCINDSNRPNEIPESRWVKKGVEYTVVQVDKLNAQGGLYGYKLAELNIDDLAPYQYFDSNRFSPSEYEGGIRRSAWLFGGIRA